MANVKRVCDGVGQAPLGIMYKLALLLCVAVMACGDDHAGGDDGGVIGNGMCDPSVAGSSFDRIDAALASGAIDLETSIEYKAFAQFGDARLPAECLGDDSDVVDSDVFDLVADNWATMSPSAQEVLEPFVIPPAYVGSWANPARGKRGGHCEHPGIVDGLVSLPTLGDGMFKVWFDPTVAGQADAAQTVLDAANKSYTALVGTLMMKAPIGDGPYTGCNGGDGRIDIYLVKLGSKGGSVADFGQTFPIDVETKARPAFMLVSWLLPENALKATVAHELMHVIQWGYPVAGATFRGSYPWLKESTAQWAIDYVYPTEVNNFEQDRAASYQTFTQFSIDSKKQGANFTYGSYLFFQYLARTYNPSVIKAIWDQTLIDSDERLAVDHAIPGNLKACWPEFAKLLWNQDPVESNSFKMWDNLVGAPAITQQGVALDASGAFNLKLDGDLPHLAIRYYFFTFNQNDTTLRSVAISVPTTKISVQAFTRIGNAPSRVYEKWDPGTVKHYCIDITSERLSELAIVLSNDSPTEDAMLVDLEKPRLTVSSVGCWRYQGTTSVKTQDLFNDETVTTNVTLELDPLYGNDYFGHYMIHSGNGSMTSDTNDGANCVAHYMGNGSLDFGEPGGSVDVDFGLDYGLGDPNNRSVLNMTGNATWQTDWTMICSGTTVTGQDPYLWTWLEQPAAHPISVRPDGDINITINEPPKTYSYNLTPVRQP